MNKLKLFPTIFILFIVFISCSKKNTFPCVSVLNQEDLFNTNWVLDNTEYDFQNSEYTKIFTSESDLNIMKEGFNLNENGDSKNMSVLGWCGTPPYQNVSGTWHCDDGDGYLVNTYEKGMGQAYDHMEILSLTSSELIVKFHLQ